MEDNILPSEQDSKNGKITLSGAVFIRICSIVGALIDTLLVLPGKVVPVPERIHYLEERRI